MSSAQSKLAKRALSATLSAASSNATDLGLAQVSLAGEVKTSKNDDNKARQEGNDKPPKPSPKLSAAAGSASSAVNKPNNFNFC